MTELCTKVERVAIGGGLDEFEAAAFLALPLAVFRQLVAQGSLPLPRVKGQRKLWDAAALDRAHRTAADGSRETASRDWVKLKNVDRFIDRHGKPRHYFRASKGIRIRLPGEPGSPDFMNAYERAKQMQAMPKLASRVVISGTTNFPATFVARSFMFAQAQLRQITPWS